MIVIFSKETPSQHIGNTIDKSTINVLEERRTVESHNVVSDLEANFPPVAGKLIDNGDQKRKDEIIHDDEEVSTDNDIPYKFLQEKNQEHQGDDSNSLTDSNETPSQQIDNTIDESTIKPLKERSTEEDHIVVSDLGQKRNNEEIRNLLNETKIVPDSPHQNDQLNKSEKAIDIKLDNQDSVTEVKDAQHQELLTLSLSVVDKSVPVPEAQLHSGHSEENSTKPAVAEEDPNSKTLGSKPPRYPGKVGHDQRLHAHHGYQQSNPGHNLHPRSIHHPTDYFGQHSHNRQQRNQYPNHQYHHGPHHTGHQQGRPLTYAYHPYVPLKYET